MPDHDVFGLYVAMHYLCFVRGIERGCNLGRDFQYVVQSRPARVQ